MSRKFYDIETAQEKEERIIKMEKELGLKTEIVEIIDYLMENPDARFTLVEISKSGGVGFDKLIHILEILKYRGFIEIIPTFVYQAGFRTREFLEKYPKDLEAFIEKLYGTEEEEVD